jgi:uncharacterized membrane protein YczE
MTTVQLETELKKSKWGVIAVLGILLLGIFLKMMFVQNASLATYFGDLIWLFMVALFVFNYRTVRDELTSRGKVHA